MYVVVQASHSDETYFIIFLIRKPPYNWANLALIDTKYEEE